MKHLIKQSNKGFTLIELLVVISIIALLSSVVLTSVNNAKVRARTAQRVTMLKQIQLALELYRNSNVGYPNSGGTGSWRSECPAWGGLTANNVIPGLAPTYIPVFPSDPTMDKANNYSCLIYTSNGTHYKLLDHDIRDPGFDFNSYPTFIDPVRPAYSWAVSNDMQATAAW